MQEIFKTIPDYPNYQVSNLGRIKSISRKEYNFKEKERILKNMIGYKGYLKTILSKNGKSKIFSVHRLVYLVFNNLPLDFKGYDTKTLVCHKDDNPENSKLENLFLGTQSENMKDCYFKKRNHIFTKEEHLRKLTEKDVIDILRMIKEGLSQTSIAKIYKVTKQNIYHIKNNNIYKYIPR